ncbi:ABC transporter permease [Clostridium oceanicum]|uniref:ABC transporter permease n=1 Tax=Clostridium oceanicum TaxID=1543 RepID=A0ABP3USP4_9CLOT
MRILALVKRIFIQILNDKRTLALMMVAPLILLTLMNFLFQSEDNSNLKVGVYNIDKNIVTEFKDNDVNVKKYSNNTNIKDKIKKDDLDAFISNSNDKLDITHENSNTSKTMKMNLLFKNVMTSFKTENLTSAVKKQTEVIKKQGEAIKNQQKTISHMTKQLTQAKNNNNFAQNSSNNPREQNLSTQIKNMNKKNSSTSPDIKDKENSSTSPTIETHYIYGSEDTTLFDMITPVLIGFFVFFFVFLISGISLLKERTSGTLDKLLASPIKRKEIVFGYLLGYGLFAIIQTFIIVFFSIYVLKLHIVGSLGLVLLTNILTAFVALSFGILLSTFANSEFQMMQFIPAVVIPQIFFSGIISIDNMAPWLQKLCNVIPLYYIGDALKKVIIKGENFSSIQFDLSILLVFAIIFTGLNILGLKKYRKV